MLATSINNVDEIEGKEKYYGPRCPDPVVNIFPGCFRFTFAVLASIAAWYFIFYLVKLFVAGSRFL